MAGPASVTGAGPQVPGSVVVEEQIWPVAQVFPPTPRQPSLHWCVEPSQSRPTPHSESLRQPETQPPVDVSQTGVAPPHSLFDEHFRHLPPVQIGAVAFTQANDAPEPKLPLHGSHVPFVVSQIGAESGQSALVTQPHFLVAVTQALTPVHAVTFVEEHCSHLPSVQAGRLAVAHGLVAVEPKSPLQDSQTLVVALHCAAVAGQSAFVLQPQVFVATTQTGLSPVHAVVYVAEHSSHLLATHAPLAVVGQGAVAVEPLSPLQATHVLLVASQTGAVAGQSALEAQPHVFVVVLQTGAVPLHAVALVAEHCTQRPETHAGAVPLGHARVAVEPKSPLQASQTPAVALQIGVADGHSELVLQPHLFVVVLQTGFAPVQAAALVAEHSSHWPDTHARSADVGQAFVAPLPLSPLQVTHTLVVVSQTGKVLGQVELDVQPQVCVVALQVGLEPVHADVLVVEHCSQRPPTHARSVDVGHARVADEPLSPLHAWHTPSVVLQTGVASGHAEVVVHPQVFVDVLHVGVVPVQADPFVAEHCLQTPATHAGAVVGQACEAVEPASPLQPTQVPVVASQNAVAPVHAVALVAEHCLQEPDTHAGADPGHALDAPEPLSPLQPTQVLVVVSQNAVAPVHAVEFVAEH